MEIIVVELLAALDDRVLLPVGIVVHIAQMVDIPQINLVATLGGTERVSAVGGIPAGITHELHELREAAADELRATRHLVEGIEADVLQHASHANGILVTCRHKDVTHVNLIILPAIAHLDVVAVDEVHLQPTVEIVFGSLRVDNHADALVDIVAAAAGKDCACCESQQTGGDDMLCFHNLFLCYGVTLLL